VLESDKMIEMLCLYYCIKGIQGLISHRQAKSHGPLQSRFLLLEWPKPGLGSELAMGQSR